MLRFEVNKREDFGADFVLEASEMLSALFGCIDTALLSYCLFMVKLIMICDWHKGGSKI